MLIFGFAVLCGMALVVGTMFWAMTAFERRQTL